MRHTKKEQIFNYKLQSLEGKILIAAPNVADDFFEKSLIYVCAHDSNGAIGIVINKKICDINILDLMIKNGIDEKKGSLSSNSIESLILKKIKDKDYAVKKDRNSKSKQKEGSFAFSSILDPNFRIPLAIGGPVNKKQIIAISISKEGAKVFNKEKKNNVGLHVDLNNFIMNCISEKIKLSKVLFVKGVSVWDPMQLEEEINNNYWLIADASLEMIFSSKKTSSWEYVIHKFGIKDERYFSVRGGNC